VLASIRLFWSKKENLIKVLIENSVKFSEQGTSIKATGIKSGQYFRLTFSDESIGFCDDCIKIISPFQQFERQKYATVW